MVSGPSEWDKVTRYIQERVLATTGSTEKRENNPKVTLMLVNNSMQLVRRWQQEHDRRQNKVLAKLVSGFGVLTWWISICFEEKQNYHIFSKHFYLWLNNVKVFGVDRSEITDQPGREIFDWSISSPGGMSYIWDEQNIEMNNCLTDTGVWSFFFIFFLLLSFILLLFFFPFFIRFLILVFPFHLVSFFSYPFFSILFLCAFSVFAYIFSPKD